MNEKVIVYLRTSTKDQNPELQRQSCIDFCSDMGLEIVEVVSEQGSAYKLEKVRPKWESVAERSKNEKLSIVVWRYDRSFRNRKDFYIFMKIMFEVYGVKIYSVTEPSILSFWNILDKKHTEDPIVNELMKQIFKALWDFMIQQAGEESEEESRKKSQRITLAVRKEKGKDTKSYKGRKWGRKSIKCDEDIVRLANEGKSLRQIASEVFYWDKSNNKKFVSLGYVHKTLAKFNAEKVS